MGFWIVMVLRKCDLFVSVPHRLCISFPPIHTSHVKARVSDVRETVNLIAEKVVDAGTERYRRETPVLFSPEPEKTMNKDIGVMSN